MAGFPWKDDEWKFCLDCFRRNITKQAALNEFWERYPKRSSVAIDNRLQHTRISLFSVLGSKVPKSKLEEHQQKSVEEVLTGERYKKQIQNLRAEIDSLRKEAVTSDSLVEVIHGLKESLPCFCLTSISMST
jgi:hypothetical protein